VTAPGQESLAELLNEFVQKNPAAEAAQFSRDDIGNGRRFNHYFGDKLRYVTDEGTWRIWDDRSWRVAHDAEILDLGVQVADRMRVDEIDHISELHKDEHEKHAAKSRSHSALMAMSRMAAAQSTLWTVHASYDVNPYLFNCSNGTIELGMDECTLREHRRDDLISKLCTTPFERDAKSPLVDEFLDRFLPDEAERWYVLSTLAVAALAGGNPQRALLILIGPTTTGKTTLIDLITQTLGEDYVAAVNASVFKSTNTDAPRPDVLKALQARLAVASEGADSWELHADQIKRMTGGDKIVARGMNSNTMIERVPDLTPMIMTNAVPQIRGADDAVRRRLRVLLMDRQVPTEQDDGRQRWLLINDFQARKAMLALLVRHYEEAHGRMPEDAPPRFQMVESEVFADLDDVHTVLTALINDHVITFAGTGISAHQCIKVQDLYVFYRTRASLYHSSREVMSLKQFATRLKALGFETKNSNGTRVLSFVKGKLETMV
jgi:P4 family phage/plasmid primase-like protien